MTGHRAKRALKKALKHTAAAGSALFPAPAAATRILTYHSVGARDHEMNVLPEAFRQQMQWLAEHTSVLPVAEAAAGAPGIAITFDDGYADILSHAAPVLRELGLPATLFMVADKAGNWLPHDPKTPEARLLTCGELRELNALGVAIGAHGMTHRRLSELDADGQRDEIMGSKHTLEDALGQEITAFAYPYGSALDFNATSVDLVREAGYRYAVTNQYGPNGPQAPCYLLRRIWIDRTDSLPMFQAKIQGRLDLLRLLDSPPGIRLRRAVNTLLGTH